VDSRPRYVGSGAVIATRAFSSNKCRPREGIGLDISVCPGGPRLVLSIEGTRSDRDGLPRADL
jgi:hypothetical protein